MTTDALPKSFDEFLPFLDWALPTSAARVKKRGDASKEELLQFYNATVPHLSRALDYLNKLPLDAMSPDAERLFRIALSLAEVALYVEWFSGNSYPPLVGLDITRRIEVVREPA